MWLDRAFGLVSGLLNAMGTVLIAFLMVVINADVFGRFLFNKPVTGVVEMVIMSTAAIVFLQFSHTLRHGRVIQADSLLRVIERHWPRVYEWLQALFHVVGALTFAVILYSTIPFLQRAWASGDTYGNPAVFALPKWPVRAIMIVGCAAMLIQFVIMSVRHAVRAVRGVRP